MIIHRLSPKRGWPAPYWAFLYGCFGISVFPFSPWMRPCHFEEGVSLSGSSGDEPTTGSSSRTPFFCGLGMGEKQQSVPVSHSSLALIVSTFLQRRGAWLGGRNARCTRVCNEWQSPLGLKENCSGLCLRMHNEDCFAGLQNWINREYTDPHSTDAELKANPHLAFTWLLSWLVSFI